MKKEEIRSLAIKSVGEDKYFDEFALLESDVKFFQLYMEREKKSQRFFFTPSITYNGTRYAFGDIWRTYNYSERYLEEVYGIFIILKTFINDFYNTVYSTGKLVFTNEEREEVVKLFNLLELDLKKYTSDFIACSQASEKVKEAIGSYLSQN